MALREIQFTDNPLSRVSMVPCPRVLPEGPEGRRIRRHGVWHSGRLSLRTIPKLECPWFRVPASPPVYIFYSVMWIVDLRYSEPVIFVPGFSVLKGGGKLPHL